MLGDSSSVFIGLRYTLARKRSRSVTFMSRIAMVGIVLGVALLILVLSVMNGFDKELRERILAIMPQVTLYQQANDNQTTWQSLRQQILQHDDIAAAAPFVELQGMVNVGKATQPLLLYGIEPSLEKTVSIVHRFLDQDDCHMLSDYSNDIILGKSLAEKLHLNAGDKLNLIIPRLDGQSQRAAIRRVTLLTTFNSGTEIDHSLAFMNLSFAQELLSSPGAVSGLHIKVHDLFHAPRVASELRSQLPFYYYPRDWTQTHGNIYYAIQMSKRLVSLLLFLIVAIAAFNVVSTLMMVVIDNQSDIAVLRTLGTSRRQIMAIFMVQGVVITVMGLFIGVCLGLLLSITIGDVIAFIESIFAIDFLQSDIYPVSYVPADIHWQDTITVVLITLAMSLTATLYPAWRATKVEPAQVLRYD